MSINNGVKLFEYLEKLSLLHTNIRKNIKNLSKEEELFDLDDKLFLPVLDKIFLKNRDLEIEKEDDLFISIERYNIEKPPKLPKELKRWIDYDLIGFIKPEPKEFIVVTEKFEDVEERVFAFNKINKKSNKIDPILNKWIIRNDSGDFERIEEFEKEVFFNDFSVLQEKYINWIKFKWEKWKEKNYTYFISNRAYDKFYALRSFLKTESDSYDLLWGHDILTWKKGDNEIYHPTFFTPVIIEFDSERNIILIKGDLNSRTFFDVSFVIESLSDKNVNVADINALAKRVNKQIEKGFDVWDYELIHRYLKELVHYISAEGESKYNNRGFEVKSQSNPIAFNQHHLFLLKKNGKSWADYAKKIQVDIKLNNKLTPFLEDLLCSDNKKEDFEINSNQEHNEINNKLYFPLPYNIEQKKIANQIEMNYGAVVQGPPGTGKTHTIANLISRFLALGKTVLVTSQTGQALSVLKEKIPRELRNMVVSQVESNSKSNDLQSSVSEINTMLSDNIKFTDEEKRKIEKELISIRKDIAKKSNEFKKKSLLDSRENITIGISKYTPISAAKFISSFSENNEFKILDDIDEDNELSVSQSQIDNYISLLKNNEESVWNFVKLDRIPFVEKLPSIDVLNRYFALKSDLNKEEVKLCKQYIPNDKELEEIENIAEKIDAYKIYKKKSLEFAKYLKDIDFFIKNNIASSDLFNGTKQEFVLGICDSLDKLKENLISFDKPWEQDLFKRMANKNEKEKWLQLYSTFEKVINEYRKYDNAIIGQKVSIDNEYEIDYTSALEIIVEILNDTQKNNEKVKKGIFSWLDSKRRAFIKNVKIDNKEINTIDDVYIVQNYFNRIKRKNDLKNIWFQAFNDMPNIIEYPEPFNVIELEGVIDTVRRIVYFDKDNIEVKTQLGEFGFFDDINITEIDFIEKAKLLFDNFLSDFRANEYNNFIDKIASFFEKENAHEKVVLLAKYIKKKDISKIEEVKKEIIELSKRQSSSVEYLRLHEDVFNVMVKELKSNKHNHKSVIAFLQNLEMGDVEEIKSFYKNVPELIDQQNKSEEIKLSEEKLREQILRTVDIIKEMIKKKQDFCFDIERSWTCKRLSSWLDRLHIGNSIAELNKELYILKNKERDLVKDLVEASAWIHLKKRVTKKQRESLASFALSMKKYGQGTGKHAGKHLSDAKKALKEGKGAVPVWIMPINMIHKLFPEPKAGMFDVVIFDEASQVDARGLNVAYIGKKLLVVGDDEQVSPTTFINENKVNNLIVRYIADVPNSNHFSTTSSLFDIAKIKMTNIVSLSEHFRSVEEIIGFSNTLSYGGKLKILRDQLPKYRLDPVLEAVFVNDGFEEKNAQVNIPEAEAIVEKLKEMLSNKKYKETNEEGENRPITFGIISLLGKDQSKYITKLISENISSREIEKRKIICGDPYVFQGDERDVIFISMVKAPNVDNPNGTIYPYSMNTKSYKQRVNVAMSRAKNKMVLFHSIPKESLSNPIDLRKMILDWFYSHKIEERKSGLQKVREEVIRGRASEFEYEVAERIINAGYKVIPQYEVAEYRIDLVVQGKNAKLAIECDGDKYHNRIEKWTEDIERQQTLERSGWTFWRLMGSAFYKDKNGSLESLWCKLKELDINPTN